MSLTVTRDQLGADYFSIQRTNPKVPKGRLKEVVREELVVKSVSSFGPFFSLSPLLALLILMAVSCSRSGSLSNRNEPVKGGLTIGANSSFKPGLSCLLEEYDSMTIPGVGEPYLDCGEFLKIWKCEKCGWEKPIPKRCFRAVCSECWKSWDTKKVKYAVARLFGYPKVYKKIKGRRVGYLAEIMISPPQDYAKVLVRGPGGYNKLRKEAIKIARRYGLDGVVVPHMWRVREEVRKGLMELGADTGSKFWGLIREDALKLGGWKKYVYLSPHFHILGYLQHTINGADVYNDKKTLGWGVYKDKKGNPAGWLWEQKANISTLAKDNAKEAIRNGKKVETEEELVAKKLFYFLSHAVIRGDKHALFWYGKLSYNQMVKADHSVIEEQRVCPECGYDLVIENLETGEIMPGLEKIDIWVYKIPPPDLPRNITEWCEK